MEETHNQKIFRITLWALVVIVVFFTFLKVPKKMQLNDTNSQIRQTEIAIKQAKIDSEKNSPINQNANLDQAQTKAQDKISEELKASLGGYKNSKEFKANESKLNEIFGNSLTNKLYRMNLAGEDQLASSTEKNPEFVLANNTNVITGFSDINDMHSSSLDALVETHEKGPDKKLYKHLVLIAFNYDLKSGGVNYSTIKKLQSISADNTIGNN